MKKTLRLIQAFFQTPESEEAGLSLVAKQVDEGGFGGMGLSLINYYAKKTKARLICMECLVPAGQWLSLGERKAQNTFAQVTGRASFEEYIVLLQCLCFQ